jgi:putative transposase
MRYSSDLTNEQWDLIKDHFDTGNYGKSRKHTQQLLVNAVLYINKTGCQWRSLPKCYPPWKTVYSFYKRAKDKNIWEKVMQALVKQSRLKLGKEASPSYSIIDSQSVKTTSYASERGIDGGKKN